MTETAGSTRLRLVLVGAGHAHLLLLRHARRLQAAGLAVSLVAPPRFRYSGAVTGVLSGRYPPSYGELDVGALAGRRGVVHLARTVTSVDRARRRLQLSDGGLLSYDLASFNVGSVMTPAAFGGEAARVWSAKPLASLVRLRAVLEREMSETGRAPSLVVAGGGRSGLEIAAALAGLARRSGVRPDVVLVSAHGQPTGDGAPPAAWRRLGSHLEQAGVRFEIGRVASRELDTVLLDTGRELEARHLVLAHGLAAQPLMERLGLPSAVDGALCVDATLRPPGDPSIFATGDGCAFLEAPRPRMGVFGVRAAPVLLHNLLAVARGGELRSYRPQRRWLSIMDLGDGNAFATRGSAWRLSHDMLRLKTWLDTAFLRRVGAFGTSYDLRTF
ncbi:MAG: pyridine nucleotide-disulfide oxidoreductase [Phenylobacterium sp.]|uniref:FAD-dependent oxidoreductase n=1 Tax=Phenylobacterium sp. TaxID=1871053 RepID=UPI0025F57AF7|nr:FAD-dependent oxidoreductase [Phenylobacterium sp.]MBI1196273.1 pyridine nucleotide-disulfide oxidoreductase [Phenylobacterium sp.]